MGEEHRGHPSHSEVLRAMVVRSRLGVCVAGLCQHGFSHDEAVAFITGVAYETGRGTSEGTWGQAQAALGTVNGLIMGRAAKHWSMNHIEMAISHINKELLS